MHAIKRIHSDESASAMKPVAPLHTLKEIGRHARDCEAHDQAALIGSMCRDTGLSISALAAAAGLSNATLTRPLKLGRPVKIEIMERLAYACSKIRSVRSVGQAGK